MVRERYKVCRDNQPPSKTEFRTHSMSPKLVVFIQSRLRFLCGKGGRKMLRDKSDRWREWNSLADTTGLGHMWTHRDCDSVPAPTEGNDAVSHPKQEITCETYLLVKKTILLLWSVIGRITHAPGQVPYPGWIWSKQNELYFFFLMYLCFILFWHFLICPIGHVLVSFDFHFCVLGGFVLFCCSDYFMNEAERTEMGG